METSDVRKLSLLIVLKENLLFSTYKTEVLFKLLKQMIRTSFYYSVPMIRILCGLWVFCSKRKHLLNTLLRLEYIILRVFWVIVLVLSLIGQEIFFSLFFLTFAACEGALGLALLVSVVRTHGNDRFGRFNLLQC